MSASITIGNVRLNRADLPERITLGGDTVSTEVDLSDGADYLAVTGWKPVPLSWSATIYSYDDQGTPLEKAEAIEAQQRQGLPVTITWSGRSIERTWQATIAQWHYTPVRDGDIEYSIDLVRATDGGLLAGGTPRPPSATQRATDTIAQMAAAAPQVGTHTQNAMASVLVQYRAMRG